MTSLAVDTTQLVDGQTADAADPRIPILDLKGHLENTLDGDQAFEQVNVGSATEVTISAGIITADRSHHRVDTEGNAATDNLDTILGGSEGDELWLRAENAARVVTVRHGTGNIFLSEATNFSLDAAYKVLRLFYNGSAWVNSANPAADFAAVVPIIKRTAVTGVASVSLSGWADEYDTLILITELRTSAAGSGISVGSMRFNGDFAANYYTYMGQIRLGAQVDNEALAAIAGYIPFCDVGAPASYLAVATTTIYNVHGSGLRWWDTRGYGQRSLLSGGLRALLGGGTWTDAGATGRISDITLLAAGSNFTNSAYTLLGVPL